MAVKKSTGTKAETKKAVAPVKASVNAPATAPATRKPAGPGMVWTLPLALLMLIFAASALWMAARDSSNRTQAATPAATAVMEPDAGKSPKPAATSIAAAPAANATSESAKPEASSALASKPVSITGCLQKNDHGFMLKDTEGADAPKSRSWKSGFFKRSPSSVALSDTGNAAHLSGHVGQRVSVTGPLVDREMHVTSVHRIAASCQ
jgi:hypothetical protein